MKGSIIKGVFPLSYYFPKKSYIAAIPVYLALIRYNIIRSSGRGFEAIILIAVSVTVKVSSVLNINEIFKNFVLIVRLLI